MKLTFSLLTGLLCACVMNVYAGAKEDLVTACQKGDLEGVKKAVADGAQVNELDAAGNPAITYAFFWPDIVKFLLENKADPNLGATTVLWQASFYASADVMKMVLDAGADPNKPMITDPSTTFKTLIAKEEAKGKDANKDLIKAWQSAMKTVKPTEVYPLPSMVGANNCVPCLEMLLEKGAKLDKGVTDGTLLHTFASSGASPEYRKTMAGTIKTSIEPYGYKVPDWYTNMPAERNASADAILKILLSKGLDINAKNNGTGGIPPQTPLEVTLGGGFGNKEEVAVALINNGADVKVKHEWYGPAILQAAQCGFANALKAMVEKGADINTQGKCFTDSDNGAQIKTFTALTCAAAKNHLEAVKVLMEMGASTEGISGSIISGSCPGKLEDKSAIYFAIEHKNMEMVKYIAEHKGYNGKKLSISAKKMTNCVGGGSYSPSEYAKALDASELKDYLKAQGL